ncbi:MAG: putative lipid II flippase FtsW [Patescibacteria group bacterium]|nr:putative lipid II flippase FtsW [Patescibacteria group bacterium]
MKSKQKKLTLLKQYQRFDGLLLIIIIALCLFGLLMIYDASSVSALADFGDKMYYVKEQIKWLFIGLVGLFIGSAVNYRQWYKLSVPLLLITLILLLTVFIPGLGIAAYGAKRWINFRFLVLQPAELAKLSLIIYLAAWLSNKEKGRFLAFLALMGLLLCFVILEPDLGTAFIIGIISLIIYFISGAPLMQLFIIIPVGVGLSIIAALTSSYRLKRIVTFLDPSKDPLGASYHIRQVLLALGSGGLLGLGLGQSRQKYAYLPEATTDSIFAIIGEEIGFVGSLILIAAFLFILYRCFKIALAAPDKFGYLLGMGITFWLGIQVLVNLSAMVTLLPLTGVPLPFISYGGSGLVVALFATGIILNISKHH